jgi:uncharacterized protein
MRNKFYYFAICFFWALTLRAGFSPILDEVGLVSKSWLNQRASLLKALYQETQTQIQIVIAKDTKGQSIEAYSISLAEQMKLGQKETDKGLLVLLVPSQRQVRIEVGQGLEGIIPDVIAKRIIQDDMIPFFRQNQFESGLDVGLSRILSIVVPEFDIQNLKNASNRVQDSLPLWLQVLIFIFMILFWFIGPKIGFIGPVGGRGSMGGLGGFGGSGSSGGWSGGGGGFSGGGASGRW